MRHPKEHCDVLPRARQSAAQGNGAVIDRAIAGVRCGILVLLLWPLATSRAEEQAAQEASTTSQTVGPAADQVAHWIRQLDSADFETRRDATRLLIEAGAQVTMPLAQAVGTGSRESMMRGVHVLEQLALSDDVATREAALVALTSVVQSTNSPAARIRAQNTIVSLQRSLQQKALVALAKLGADISFQEFGHDPPAAIVFSTNNSIELGEKWRGTPEDLRRLEFLIDLDAITFKGPAFGDAYLEYLRLAPRLNTVIVSHAGVTDEGIPQLARIDTLRVLQLLYTPITDASIETIASMSQVRLVELCGTRISNVEAAELSTALANATVKFHRGAFLGVGPGSMPQSDKGLVVGNLAAGSAADKAGIEIGDIIAQVGDKKITNFDDLRMTMEAHPAGVPIEVIVLRNNAEMKKSVTLIERPDELASIGLIPAVPVMPVVPRALPVIPQPNNGP